MRLLEAFFLIYLTKLDVVKEKWITLMLQRDISFDLWIWDLTML
jgi:hypothetical protein